MSEFNETKSSQLPSAVKEFSLTLDIQWLSLDGPWKGTVSPGALSPTGSGMYVQLFAVTSSQLSMATKREQPLSSFAIRPRDDHSRQAVLRQAVSNSEMMNSRFDMDRGVMTLASTWNTSGLTMMATMKLQANVLLKPLHNYSRLGFPALRVFLPL